MKRSTINSAYRAASACFARHCWTLPPKPRWDIADFGLGEFDHYGLVLVNLATESEYCEKLMWARRGQTTRCHAHAKKKEDIICRAGALTRKLWSAKPIAGVALPPMLMVLINGYADAQARQIFRDLLDMPAQVAITPDEVCVEFHRRAHLPIVLDSDLCQRAVEIPWWNGRRLRLTTHTGR
jgi:D-lyxose ketol-isomerase